MGKGKEEKNAIVLRVFMHCQGCSDKVFDCLKCFEGVEEIEIDIDSNKVTLKGTKADPLKVLARLKKKYSKNCELLSSIQESCKEEKPSEKKEEPKIITVVFKILMHCEGCVEDIRVLIERMKGNNSNQKSKHKRILIVEIDMANSRVSVKGIFDPEKVVEKIGKRLGKYVEILEVQKPKKEAKEDDKDKNKKNGKDKKKKNAKNKEDDEEENIFQCPSQYSVNYVYPNQTFSDENVFSCIIM